MSGLFHTLVIRTVVTDGLTFGHWRCSTSSSQLEELAFRYGLPQPNGPHLNPLPKVTSCFCPSHEVSLDGWCQAQPCTELAVGSTKICGNPLHLSALDTFARQKKRIFLSNLCLTGQDPICPQIRRFTSIQKQPS